MARINIEDSIFKDPRWFKLILKSGCEYKALGLVTAAWSLAQIHWLKNKSIPSKAWRNDFDILIEVGLAERLDDGSVYIKGSKKSFAWIDQKSTSGQIISEKKLKALESARSKRWPKEPTKEANSLNGIRTDSERDQNGSEPLSLTLTHSNKEIINNFSPELEKPAPEKKKSIFSFEDFLETIPDPVKQNWTSLYDKDFLSRETVKAANWCLARPKKNRRTERGWISFLSNWFEKGWDNHARKS